MLHLIYRPFDILSLYIKVLLQYTNFDGRASRSEFCLFFGLNLFFLALLSGPVQYNAIESFGEDARLQFILALTIPSIALGVRRMHDCGKKGWYFLIPGYNLILAFSKGKGSMNEVPDNEWVPDPRCVFCHTENTEGNMPFKDILPTGLQEGQL